MKIEMGESLFYSWLRHVKECQIVQTNWKVSNQWDLKNEHIISEFINSADTFFSEKYNYNVFKNNSSMAQIIQQAECDAIGMSIQETRNFFYAVDVAFHGAGLNYGSKDETIMKIIAKTLRTAMCLYGYLKTTEAEIIFASPKINNAVLVELEPCISDINDLFKKHNFGFNARLIANEDFNNTVLKPILLVSEGIADTSELFIRSYQMYTMFGDVGKEKSSRNIKHKKSLTTENEIYSIEPDDLAELKIGKIAQVILRKMLEDGAATEEEIKFMQTDSYSKQFFDLNYPLLVKAESQFDKVRYYSKSLYIHGVEYKMCSQWFEVSANNDRPYLIRWINNHKY